MTLSVNEIMISLIKLKEASRDNFDRLCSAASCGGQSCRACIFNESITVTDLREVADNTAITNPHKDE